jgi:hypothetical protein
MAVVPLTMPDLRGLRRCPHRNIMAESAAVSAAPPVPEDDDAASYIPIAVTLTSLVSPVMDAS